MNLKKSSNIACSLFKARFLNKRTPLVVSWMLTNRCNRKCTYCNIPNIKCEELDTNQIFSVIKELKNMGCERIGFTGGEPLLREGIGEVINYSKNKGIFTGLVTNGALVPEKINEISSLDLLQLSLDGPESWNDKQRYKGAYRETIKAIKIAKSHDLRVWLTCVLTKYTVEHVESVIRLAEKFDVKVFFQPVVSYKNCGDVSHLFPSERGYKKVAGYLIKNKNKKRVIANSKHGLKYLYNWPNRRNMKCFAGRLLAHIYSNGDVYPCFNMDDKDVKNCLSKGFKEAFTSIKIPNCNSCWTYANVEFNYLFSLNPSTLLNTLSLIGLKNG